MIEKAATIRHQINLQQQKQLKKPSKSSIEQSLPDESSSSEEEVVDIQKMKQQMNEVNRDANKEMVIPEESKISKTLSDKTTKIVVILVLFLLFMLAFCSTD